jgi:peptidoglycan hydrolase CwlO-like protein
MKRFKLIMFISFAIFIAFVLAFSVAAEGENNNQDSDKILELQRKIQEAEAKLKETRAKKNTLSSQISYMNSQINLTSLKINETEREIKLLVEQIESLSGRIQKLETSLTSVSQVLINRIVATYKTREITPLQLLFSSRGFNDFLNRAKYIKVAQAHDKKLMYAIQSSKNSYQKQKILREEKKDQLEKLQIQLEGQKKALDQQREAKKRLLGITKNDEKRYQQLLKEARAQLASFRRFVNNQGGASILNNQTKCDDWGCYYNQRDSQWGNMSMGGYSYSVAEYGCLVTSVAMVASHNGLDIKPNDIAGNPSAFVPGTGYLYHSFNVDGKKISLSWASKDKLDEELNAGRPVIAGLYSGPDHFIVITKKDGDKYIMRDPFLENGSNRPLSDKYNLSDITSLRLVQFN